jgi:phosphate transport system permease protein
MANAILGSAEILAMASLIGIPLGIVGGIHLAEYAQHRTASQMQSASWPMS